MAKPTHRHPRAASTRHVGPGVGSGAEIVGGGSGGRPLD
jgi:hypothetical protein